MKTIQWCAMTGDVEGLKELIQKKPDLLQARGQAFGCSLLTLAGMNGRLEAVKFLLSEKIDIYVQNSSGNTVLHELVTIIKGCRNYDLREIYYNIVGLILGHEAMFYGSGPISLLEIKDNDGVTPLWTVDSPEPAHQEIKDKILRIAQEARAKAQFERALVEEEKQQREGLQHRELYSETPAKILTEKPAPKERGCFAGFFQALGFGGAKPAAEDECFLLKVK